MKTTADFLDEVKKKKGLVSDYKLAQIMKVKPNKIAQYRKGKSILQLIDCITVSEILDIPPMQIMAEIGISQGKKEEEKKRWVDFLKRVPGIAAAAALIILVNGGVAQTWGDGVLQNVHGRSVDGLYIMRSKIMGFS